MVMTNTIYNVAHRRIMQDTRPELVDDLTLGIVYIYGGTNPSYEIMHRIQVSIPYYGAELYRLSDKSMKECMLQFKVKAYRKISRMITIKLREKASDTLMEIPLYTQISDVELYTRNKALLER